jgi:diaminopimelate epimerase
VAVHVQSGDVLTVGFNEDGGAFRNVTLTGPAAHVYDGTYRMSAAR